MTTIIGRAKEKKELEEIYTSTTAEFVVVYGRRRIGKTYLIKNFFTIKKCIYFQTVGIYKGSLEIQLARFAKELGETFYQGAPIRTFTSWMEAFDALTNAIRQSPKNQKIVMFFDELPWLSTKKSGLVSALEYFWNRYWADDKRIKLITCGSAASWMIKKILKNKGGLHNRISRKIRLLPFNLSETELYLKHMGYFCSRQQIAKLYMVMGGIPYYLKHIKKNLSIDQNIENLFFNPDGLLFDEFDELFTSLFDDSEQYKELIIMISAHRDGIPRNILDLKNKLTGKGGRLSTRLENLETAGLITNYLPYAHKKQGVFYKLSDEYSYFYQKWIAPVKAQLKQSKAFHYWKSITKTPEYFNWHGYMFEILCYKHISHIKKALHIPESSLCSPWRYIPRQDSGEQGAQIDLLFDRDDNAITICEIKYTENPFTLDKNSAEKLKRRVAIFKKITRTDKQIFIALISANGITKTLYSEDMISSVVSLMDLFEDLMT